MTQFQAGFYPGRTLSICMSLLDSIQQEQPPPLGSGPNVTPLTSMSRIVIASKAAEERSSEVRPACSNRICVHFSINISC